MKAGELERLHQGPDDCVRSCYEIGMHMTALVLVSNQLPGCVCQPNLVPLVPNGVTPVPNGATPNGATPVPNGAPVPVSDNAAAAAISGEVVIAAAAAAQRQSEQARQQARTK